MSSNQLIFRNVIIVAIAFMFFVAALVVGTTLSNENNKEKLTVCVQAGGSWDNGQGDCNMSDN